MWNAAPLLALLLLLGSAHEARAAPWTTAASLGRGGATLATPSVGAGFVDNPALSLGRSQDGLRTLVGLTVDTRAVRTRRWGDPSERTAEAPPDAHALPLLAAWGPLGIAHLGVGAWIHLARDERAWFPGQEAASPLVPNAADRQRYGALRYRWFSVRYGLSLAWQPRPWIRVGLAAAARWLRVSHGQVLWTGTPSLATQAPESPADDAAIHISLEDGFVPEGRLGLFLAPHPNLRLGLAATLPGVAHLRGAASLAPQTGSHVDPLSTEGRATLRVRPPWSVAVALGVDSPWISLDAQARLWWAASPRETQARITGLLLRRTDSPTIHAVETAPLEPRSRPHLDLGVGIEARIPRTSLSLLGGYRFLQSAIDPRDRSAARVDPDAHVASVGICVTRGPVRLHAAYAHVWAISRGGPGRAVLTNPAFPDATPGIASGYQERSGDLVSVSLSVRLTSSP